MEIILWIVGGVIVLALAWVLLKLVAMLVGLSLVLGFLTWLFFDSFWVGAIIGGVITLIMVITNPHEFFERAMEEPMPSSKKPAPPSKNIVSMRDGAGRNFEVEKRLETTDGFYDEYGNYWQRQSDDSYIKRTKLFIISLKHIIKGCSIN